MSVQLIFALFNGLANGMAVFLVAAGLTLIYGILRVLNFAHGSFFMVGAYLTFTLLGGQAGSTPLFVLASIGGGVVVGLLGLLVDSLVFRRIRNADEHIMLVATFALLMIVQGVTKMIWGMDYRSMSPPDALSGGMLVGPIFMPIYSLFVIAMGAIVFIVLDVVTNRLWMGKLMRAIANDPWMTSILGYNVPAGFSIIVIAAFALAGMAGGLLLPNQSLSPVLGDSYLILAFVVVIVGGLGNIRGAFLAAILLGLIEAIGLVFLPELPGLTAYVAMILALLIWPNGILNRSTL